MPETTESSLVVTLREQLDHARREVDAYREQARRQTGRLAEGRETLEKRVAERTAAAEERARQLRHLAVKLAQTEQRERRRLALVLHDQLQQLLVGSKMQVQMIQRRFSDEISGTIHGELKKIIAVLDESIEATRTLAVDLSPPLLYNAGLLPALEWLAERFLERYGLEVRLSFKTELEPDDEAVRCLLFEATRELLFNVVKHAGVSEAKVAVDTTGGEYFRMTIHDAGAGFDVSSLRNSRKQGIGLFHVRERLLMIGGELRADSVPGRGTTMVLTVPLCRAVQAEGFAEQEGTGGEEAGKEPVAAPGKVVRLLLVEDHRVVRAGLTELINHQPDIEVVAEAADGNEAVEKAREYRPDVVVMDIALPGINGIEATRQIRAACEDVRIIGLSMHQEQSVASAMIQAGACDYLAKDGPPEVLFAAIRGRSGVSA